MLKLFLKILVALLFVISVIVAAAVNKAYPGTETPPMIEEAGYRTLDFTIDRIVVSEPKVNEPLVIGEAAAEPEPEITVRYGDVKTVEQMEETTTVVKNEISNNTQKPGGELSDFDELLAFMQDCCADYSVPYALALAVAEVETDFDPYAVSSTGDHGLMQINRINHEWLTEVGLDPLTQKGNIEAGIYILADNLEAYGSVERALMAYNCGDAGAQRLWDAGTYETEYSRKVMAAYERWTEVLETAGV